MSAEFHGIKWTKKMVEMFIILLQQHECLYNIRSKEYLDRIKKADTLNEILLEMRGHCENITVEDLKKKVRVLCTQYMREQRLIEQSKKSGSGMNDIYSPKLWCFDQLAFLKPHSLVRPSVSNIENNQSPAYHQETLTSDMALDFKNNADKTPKKMHRKSDNPTKSFVKNLDGIRSLIKDRSSGKKYDWLGKLVASQMEEIPENKKQSAAWEVQLLMKKLVESAHQVDIPTPDDLCEISILSSDYEDIEFLE